MDDATAESLLPDRTWYDRIAPVYGLIDGLESAARVAGVRALALHSGERVLEVGPGPGATLVELARAVLPGGHVTGIDLSRAMLERCRRRLLAEGLSGAADLVQGDARRLPFADGVFDAAYLGFTLELFTPRDMPLVLREVSHVLRPGGRLVVVALLATPQAVTSRLYGWLHRLLPSVVDCRPIDVTGSLIDAGFGLSSATRLSLWGLPVAVVTATAPQVEARV